MPARLRQSAGRPANSSEAEKQYDIPGLNISQSLSWRPGKAIPVADLLARLENLSSQLRAYDEDQVDSQKFTPLAQDLANPNLLGHKDKGVRAWAISCVVDVLKTCAPEAPFLDAQLKVRCQSALTCRWTKIVLGHLHSHHQFDSASACRPDECV